MTVGEVKERLAYPEFLSWMEYIRRDAEKRTKDEFYAAALRLEMVRLRRTVVGMLSKASQGEEPTVDTFLLARQGEVAEAGVKQLKPVGVTPEHGDAYLAVSKAAWRARLGM